MVKFSLKEIFHKPISGEWGNEPTDDYVEIIKTNNILNFGKIDFSNTTLREVDTQKVESKKLEYGDILVEKSGGSPANPVGRVCFFNKNEGTYLTNNFMSTLRLKNSNFDSKYVFYYLFNLYRKKVVLNFQNQTTGIINFKLDRYLNEISIYQIDLNKQKLIANTLDNVNELVELRKESITKLDALAKSIFIDIFGDPVSNPKEWKITTCIAEANCIVPGRDKPKSFTGTLKWVTTGDLKDRRKLLIKDIILGLNDKEIAEVKAKIIPKNSVIFTCVGDLGIVSITDEDIVMNQQLHSFQCKENLNNVFLMFNISYQKPYMYKFASQTTVPYMNKTTCNNIPLILPPIDLQNKFAKIIEKIEEQKSLYEKELEKLEENFQALLQKSFQE